MELALISPLDQLRTAEKQRYQLLLPPLFAHRVYRDYAMRVSNDPRTYTILDNGAAEGQIATGREIVALHREYHFDEIVMPDIMGDADGTARLSKNFFNTWRYDLGKLKSVKRDPGLKLGYVLHGDTILQCINHLRELKKDRFFWTHIKVLYIPRRFILRAGLHARLDLTKKIRNVTGDREIHFLGADPGYPREVQELSKFFDLWSTVRSMDTSLPFVWASHHMSVTWPNYSKESFGRKPNYFATPFTLDQRAIAQQNCEVLNAWARGEEAPLGEVRGMPLEGGDDIRSVDWPDNS